MMLHLYHSLCGPGRHSDPDICLCHCRSDHCPGVDHHETCLSHSDLGILKIRERWSSVWSVQSSFLQEQGQIRIIKREMSSSVNWNIWFLTFSIAVVSAWPFIHVSTWPCSPVWVRLVWSHVDATITVAAWHWTVIPLCKTVSFKITFISL